MDIPNNEKSDKIKKWSPEKVDEFRDCIDRDKIRDVEHELNQVQLENLDIDQVNHLVENVNSILQDSAKTVFGTFGKHNNNKKKNPVTKENKPWFNDNCWQKRKAFRIAKRRHKNHTNSENRECMKVSEKNYKREMNKAIANHRRDLRKKLNNLKSTNTKEYWNLLRDKRSKVKPEVPIDIFHDFFKDLNSGFDDNDDIINITLAENHELNENINGEITEDEILKCVRQLKNGKASGDDLIVNEYIKSTCHMLMPVYLKLFNLIFNTGKIPEAWLTGNIIPFYKNKGSKNDPRNYRPITILSCVGKLFTSILNLRLNDFLENYLLLNENQSGFRKGYSTTDSIFTLHLLFELLRRKKKKLFCAFIDFAKAFDTVWRPGLWSKLLKTSINGKMFDVIVNMYNNIKSRIFNGVEYSEFFPCNIGVRQGENLSPALFSLYVNDLEEYFTSKNIIGLSSISDDIEVQLNYFVHLFVILYADDTVLLAESIKDLQSQLDALYSYCQVWKLKVNVDKSKIVIFSKGRMPNNMIFNYNDIPLDIVNEFTYLGVLFSRSGSFSKAKKANADKATRAMYDILRKGRVHNLSIECHLELFDKVIQPILLYGCEVWGHGNNSVSERVHLKFCKMLMKAKKSTPNLWYMVSWEDTLWIYPLNLE